jgi:hypothetical protein
LTCPACTKTNWLRKESRSTPRQTFQQAGWTRQFGGSAIEARYGYATLDTAPTSPYADEFHLALNLALPRQSAFSVTLLRRDQKEEVAAVNVGVPASSNNPVVILDPGPDYIPGTFDDQKLVVYAQDPATLGHDQYLLTNPSGMRELDRSPQCHCWHALSLAGGARVFHCRNIVWPD